MDNLGIFDTFFSRVPPFGGVGGGGDLQMSSISKYPSTRLMNGSSLRFV